MRTKIFRGKADSKCRKCKGRGYVIISILGLRDRFEPCPNCRGTIFDVLWENTKATLGLILLAVFVIFYCLGAAAVTVAESIQKMRKK